MAGRKSIMSVVRGISVRDAVSVARHSTAKTGPTVRMKVHRRRSKADPDKNMTRRVATIPAKAGCEMYCDIAPEHPPHDHP